MLAEPARAATPLVYVPHTKSGDVWVIDPATFAVVGRYKLGIELQHVVPSYDLTTLYASDDRGDHAHPVRPAHRQARPHPSRSPTRTTSTSPRTAAPRSRWPSDAAS